MQPDTVILGPKDPQTLNRYSYVRNSPCRYVDLSGHCEVETGEQSKENEECWKVYNELIALLGPGFSSADLWTWALSRLRNLLDWINRGIRFEGAWASQDLGVALGGLNAMLNAFRGDWGRLSVLLGIPSFGTLKYAKGQVSHPNWGGEAAGWENRVTFKEGSPLTIEMFFHETGHIIDYHLGTPAPIGLKMGSVFLIGIVTTDIGFIDQESLPLIPGPIR